MGPISISLLATGGGQAAAFYGLAALTIACAILMVVQKNPVASVLWLVLAFVGLAGLFITLQAYFLAVVEVLVYAGAVMVLFLFVVMLLDLRREDLAGVALPKVPLVGLVAALLFLAGFISVIHGSKPFFADSLSGVLAASGDEGDSVRAIGIPLFRSWLLPFEVTSVLLLTAIVGAVALTKKKL